MTLGFGENILGPFVGGTNFSAADIQGTLTGQEAQTVRLAGYDANGDAYRLSYKGVASVPIVAGFLLLQRYLVAGLTAGAVK